VAFSEKFIGAVETPLCYCWKVLIALSLFNACTPVVSYCGAFSGAAEGAYWEKVPLLFLSERS